MEKITYASLVEQGYEVENARITDVSLNMKDHGCLTLSLTLDGDSWGTIYGGYALGKGYVGAEDSFFKGSEKGLEAIMRIMDVVGEPDLLHLRGKYIRVAHQGLGSTITIIGNIIKDLWFDYAAFFKKENS